MNGRTLPASQLELQNVFNVLGMFATTIALRLHPAQSLSVLELLKYVHKKFSDAFVHQSYPYQKLVQKLRNEGKSFGLDLFRLGYNYISYPANPVFHQCTFAHFDFPSKLFLENDITLRVLERNQSLTISLDYKPASFSKVTIESFARNLVHLVETIELRANGSFSKLEGNSGAEIDRLLELGSGSKVNHQPTPLIKRFEEQVKLHALKSAIFYKDRSVSYCQLNAKANALAQLLRERGVGNGSYIPVITDHPRELVVSLIALLKIGAIYVPLDITWPQDRLKGIIDEIDPRCIIVTERTFPDLGEQLSLEVNFDLLQEPLTVYQNEVQPDSPVYMIYTSGSTGKPKGVVIPHAGLSNRIFWMDDYFGKATCHVVLQTTRYVYDSSIWQFLWPLVNGGCVVLPNEQISFDTDNIVSLIDKYRVTIIDFVPSLFDKFVHDLSETPAYHVKLQSLCHIILGGEAIVVPTTLRFKKLFPSVELTNLYGPTEATIGCVHYKIQGDEKKIPIGRPISNMKVYILNSEGKLCLRGAVGELVVAGPGVAKGYFNDGSKTAQLFIKSGYSANEILYKTGDLARWLPDGQLEFLGRKMSRSLCED
jgi:amino acid adenylation domain-containing protein